MKAKDVMTAKVVTVSPNHSITSGFQVLKVADGASPV